MSDVAIRAAGISKRYRLGARASYRALRDVITEAVAAPFRRLRAGGRAANDTDNLIWALRDVSFEIKRGEAVAFIGRNGAGKSTLLKILSRITEPTEGRGELFGRVGSLLEVGTGFHPELSGRENIFLNGSILGMTRADIRRRFDEIVAFAEVDRFIDTPVKHYSSGMYVRLAFAVAAHLEPEIFMVDEVLAVGDAKFQKKCLGKMDDVAKEGRTVLFVSHSMPAVTRLCRRGIVLSGGRVTVDANIYEAASRYMQSDLGTAALRRWSDPASAPGDATARLKSVRVICQGETSETVDIRRPVTVEMEFWNMKAGALLMTAMSFVNDQGTTLFVSTDYNSPWGARPRAAGVHRARCTVPGNLFSEGQVTVIAEVSTREPVYQIHVLEHDSVSFQVVDTGEPGSVRGQWGRDIPGAVRPMLEWESEAVGPL